MNKFKVGDVVKAISESGEPYNWTSTDHKWVGKVTDVHGTGNFRAQTISSEINSDIGGSYGSLNPEHFALVKKELEDVEVGDILVDDEGGEHFVMGVAGKMVWLSEHGVEGYASDTECYAMLELKDEGYTFKDQEPEIMEISMDEVAKKFGKSASESRIKKE
jgi:hypothetical protein